MAYEKLKMGVSPITKTVFIGRLNKKGNMWAEKRDFTSDFLACVEQYFEQGTQTEISAGGKVTVIIRAEKPKAAGKEE